MKNIIATMLLSSAIVSPMAMASGSFEEAEKAIKAGSDYGITHFREIELDDDKMEVEGWMADDWYAEIDLDRNADVIKEKRSKRGGEPWGISADDVRAYLEVARQNDMTMVEEINVSSDGYIEIEGDNSQGRELEVEFRLGNMSPIKIDLDD